MRQGPHSHSCTAWTGSPRALPASRLTRRLIRRLIRRTVGRWCRRWRHVAAPPPFGRYCPRCRQSRSRYSCGSRRHLAAPTGRRYRRARWRTRSSSCTPRYTPRYMQPRSPPRCVQRRHGRDGIESGAFTPTATSGPLALYGRCALLRGVSPSSPSAADVALQDAAHPCVRMLEQLWDVLVLVFARCRLLLCRLLLCRLLLCRLWLCTHEAMHLG